MASLSFPISPILNPNTTAAATIPSEQKLIHTRHHHRLHCGVLRATATGAVPFKEDEEEKRSLSRGNSIAVEVEVVEELPEELRRDMIPRHVAIIMDGNVRWAKQRGERSIVGHEAGYRSLKEVVHLCLKWGIKVLTVFALSTDNWIRPKLEIGFLMGLFERVLKSELQEFEKRGVRISVIGDSSKLAKSLQDVINYAEERTKHNSNLQLIVAISYSGKYDVVRACRSIAAKAKDGLIQVEDINERIIEQELETNCTEHPYPDLMIRTSGELRVSNFFLWQLAYTELLFVEPLWPDFRKAEFVKALSSYQHRKRRYGGRDS